MTLLKLTFAGKAAKVEHKTVGDKPIIEVSLCRKQKGRGNDPDTFCWIKVTIWSPPEFMKRLAKGSFVAGSGEMTTRSYEGKDGKATAIEVRCTGFDIEIDGGEQAAAPAPIKPAAAGATDDSGIPF